ncbi:MAG: type II toxin-antitoxin system PemK/MazF family toxin [Chloroflexi bacterium]|nr:type II toxin-antitoxin system PemK/MazF family toxin [Chloroflexota bacterium]
MKEGDLILAALPQADGQFKNRPVLILRVLPRYRDLLVCGISTQLHQQVVGFDEIITIRDKDFAATGLIQNSLIRLSFLSLVPRRRVIGTIGSVTTERHYRLLTTLSAYLLSAIP